MAVNPFDPWDPRRTSHGDNRDTDWNRTTGGFFPGVPQFDANGQPTGVRPSSGGLPAGGGFGGSSGSAATGMEGYATLGGQTIPTWGPTIQGGGTINAVTGGAGAAGGGWWQQALNFLGGNGGRALGAGVSALGAYQDARNAGRGGSSTGNFNTTSTSLPWLPQYNQAGLEEALRLLQGGAGGGGGGGRQPFNFLSEDILRQMLGVVQGGDPLYGPANAYVTGTLSGQSQNPLLGDLYERLGNFSDPYVDAFLQQLMGGSGLGAGPGGGGGGGGFISAGGGGGMPSSAGTPLGIADYIRPILEGQYLGEENPYLADVISAAQERTRQAYMETELPEINAMYEGASRYGGSEFGIARALGADRLAQSLGEIASTLGFQGYESERDRMQDALGIGTQWDMHLGNLGAEYARIGAQNAATGAGAASAAADRALREWEARLGATADVLGLRTGLDTFGAGGQLSLAQLLSADQGLALSMVPDLSGLDIRDWSSVLGPSLSLDQLRLQRRGQDRAAGQAAARRPWENLLNYTDIVRGLTGGYGTTTEQGFDTRNTSGGGGGQGQALTQAALAALAGWNLFGRGGGRGGN